MPKEAVFTMKLEPELREAFMAAAEASHRPASQVVRELMREYIQRQQQAAAHDAFVHDKVMKGRADIAAGNASDAQAVEARFADRRARALRGVPVDGE